MNRHLSSEAKAYIAAVQAELVKLDSKIDAMSELKFLQEMYEENLTPVEAARSLVG